MQFFKRILKEPEKESAPAVPPVERRSKRRFSLGPEFPLKAVLNLDAREKSGAPMGRSRHGWNWKGRLLDCSELGARMHFHAAFNATIGDLGGLHLELEGFELFLPCRISNIKEEEGGGIIFGLKYEITDPAADHAYRQLVEIVAMGAALKPHAKSTKPDATGYLVEQYASDKQSRLTVWREKSDKEMMAFEFLLKDCLVRGAQEQELQYLDGTDAATHAATPAKAAEIHRLFHWITPNLPSAVPADVRAFLQYFAT